MKKSTHNRLCKAAAALILTAFAAFPSYAAITGSLDSVASDSITGQAADSENPSAILNIELTISGGKGPGDAVITTVKTSKKSPQSFSLPMDWEKQSGDVFLVTGEIVTETSRIPLSGSWMYEKDTRTAKKLEAKEKRNPAPASLPVKVIKKEQQKEETKPAEKPKTTTAVSGDYLGQFTASGYCNCENCSGGHNLTYSGTVPKAEHTIAADLDHYPLGTKLLIDGVVYTVEDMGGGVSGNRLDIYFATHEEAVAYGLKTVDVYAVKTEENP